jgi:hypothetical protein
MRLHAFSNLLPWMMISPILKRLMLAMVENQASTGICPLLGTGNEYPNGFFHTIKEIDIE